MRKPKTPARWRRRQSGVPTQNHEVVFSRGIWLCRSCPFVGDYADGVEHIIDHQFIPEPTGVTHFPAERAPYRYSL
jgi:hypothetical protein